MNLLTSAQVNELLETARPGALVYLIGAGGCGMSALGHLLLDLGCRLAGSDLAFNEEVRGLRARGATIHVGHAAEQLRAVRPALVVYSSAIRANNPELLAAQEERLPLARRAVALAALLHRQRGICVAGMHGKTTTAALLTFALEALRANPSFAIGARVPQLPRHARFTRSAFAPNPPRCMPSAHRYFVVEADESDGTLREFHPEHAVLLNVDEDHLDYFASLEAICREFRAFAEQTRGLVVFSADDPRLAEVLARRPGAISYGFHPLADYRIERSDPGAAPTPAARPAATSGNADPSAGQAGSVPAAVRTSSAASPGGPAEAALTSSEADTGRHPAGGTDAPRARFTVWHRGEFLGEFTLQLLGEQNISNAAAVIALLHQLGFAPDEIARALAGFRGAARRQELLFADGRYQVYDDYAHHPVEVEATLRAFRSLAPRRLLVAFQPHRYSRTQHLLERFATSFRQADVLWLTDIYAASETPLPGVSGPRLADAVRRTGQDAAYCPNLDGLRRAIRAAMQPGDLVAFLGAGDLTDAAQQLAEDLKADILSNKDQIHAELAATLSAESVIRRDEPLARRTTLRVGGPADFYVEPGSEADLSALLKFCGARRLPFVILGRGSNLLVRDGGIRGVVICLAHPSFRTVDVAGDRLYCGAGAKLKTVAAEARRHQLAGLEFLEGIPGSVGGALRMNAGAMGNWMFEIVETVRFMDYDGRVHERRAGEIHFEYRGCPLFKNHVALGAMLKGTPMPREAIEQRVQRFSQRRWETQPAAPSAGCIFKNPREMPAGQLIEELGLKGRRIGGAVISELHGNFIINDGDACAKDVLDLIELVRREARTVRGIELETEVEILGEG
jgi:UDP-N-acetylenolpyruvoylglucosamine reductase